MRYRVVVVVATAKHNTCTGKFIQLWSLETEGGPYKNSIFFFFCSFHKSG